MARKLEIDRRNDRKVEQNARPDPARQAKNAAQQQTNAQRAAFAHSGASGILLGGKAIGNGAVNALLTERESERLPEDVPQDAPDWEDDPEDVPDEALPE